MAKSKKHARQVKRSAQRRELRQPATLSPKEQLLARIERARQARYEASTRAQREQREAEAQAEARRRARRARSANRNTRQT